MRQTKINNLKTQSNMTSKQQIDCLDQVMQSIQVTLASMDALGAKWEDKLKLQNAICDLIMAQDCIRKHAATPPWGG